MKETIQNLLKVKSIVTIVLTLTLVLLLATGTDLPQEFTFIYNTVIAFYFGTQYQKGVNEKDGISTHNPDTAPQQIRKTDGGTGSNSSGGSV